MSMKRAIAGARVKNGARTVPGAEAAVAPKLEKAEAERDQARKDHEQTGALMVEYRNRATDAELMEMAARGFIIEALRFDVDDDFRARATSFLEGSSHA